MMPLVTFKAALQGIEIANGQGITKRKEKHYDAGDGAALEHGTRLAGAVLYRSHG